MFVSTAIRPPNLLGQFIGSVTDEDDVYGAYVVSSGVRVNLVDLKTLETVYDDGEVDKIRSKLLFGEAFDASFLSDKIVDVSLHLFSNENNNLFCLGANTASYFNECQNIPNLLMQPIPENVSYVILPVMQQQNKWNVVVYDTSEKHFIHYSFDKCYVNLGFGADNIKKNLNTYTGLELDDAPVICKQIQLLDEADCGVYLIHIVKC